MGQFSPPVLYLSRFVRPLPFQYQGLAVWLIVIFLWGCGFALKVGAGEDSSNSQASSRKPHDQFIENRPAFLVTQPLEMGDHCNLESVNAAPWVSSTSIDPANPLTITGWAADTQRKSLADATYLVVMDTTQRTFYALVHQVPGSRPDVADHFKKQTLIHSGFTITARLDNLPPGNYSASIIMDSEGRALSCTVKRAFKIKTFSESNYFDQTSKLILTKIKAYGTILVTKPAEYLFFVGALFISLLFLQKRRWILSKVSFLLGVLWVIFHEPTANWLSTLGGDSIAEAQEFTLDDAKFWIQTMSTLIQPNYNPKLLGLYFAITLCLVILLRLLKKLLAINIRQYSYFKFVLATCFIGISVHTTFYQPARLFIDNSNAIAHARSNFSVPAPPVTFRNERMNVVVYIGESTSVMNMGIYGYIRDTTPELSKLRAGGDNLLVFSNVFSTHTHTSPSLMEALSLGIDERQIVLPITERKRLSLIDIFANTGKKPTLFSNQGQVGTWNMASTIVFRNAKRFFSIESRMAGNSDHKLTRPWDHIYFDNKVGDLFSRSEPGRLLVFLHSTAGHGEYLNYIPEDFRQPVDDRYSQETSVSQEGQDSQIQTIEEYDSSIRYIDHTVKQQINIIAAIHEPIVFIYFSDHGDAAFEELGHDSSRFVHEMARVPFLMYFNDSAIDAYPEIYSKYLALASSGNTATLAQLPGTILDLFGIQAMNSDGTIDLIIPPPIGEEMLHPPIIVRGIADGIAYVNINENPLSLENHYNIALLDWSDGATKLFSLAKASNKDPKLCYGNANSLSKVRRASLVADCLHVGILIGDRGQLAIHPPSREAAGVDLTDLVRLSAANNLSLWLDIRDSQPIVTCESLLIFFTSQKFRLPPILIDVQSMVAIDEPEMAACLRHLRNQSIAIAYAVPHELAVKCTQILEGEATIGSDGPCHQIEVELGRVIQSGLFTDLSFDKNDLSVLERIQSARQLRWNVRNLDLETDKPIDSFKFHLASYSLPGPD